MFYANVFGKILVPLEELKDPVATFLIKVFYQMKKKPKYINRQIGVRFHTLV